MNDSDDSIVNLPKQAVWFGRAVIMSQEVCYLRASHHSAPVGILSLQVSPHPVLVLSCKIDRSLFTYPCTFFEKQKYLNLAGMT